MRSSNSRPRKPLCQQTKGLGCRVPGLGPLPVLSTPHRVSCCEVPTLRPQEFHCAAVEAPQTKCQDIELLKAKTIPMASEPHVLPKPSPSGRCCLLQRAQAISIFGFNPDVGFRMEGREADKLRLHDPEYLTSSPILLCAYTPKAETLLKLC